MLLPALALALGATPCLAQFPGSNGKIAFTSTRHALGNFQIYEMNSDGSSQGQVTDNTSSDSAPSFSADGQKIAFYSSRDGNEEIYSMNTAGTNQTRLTVNPASETNPTFSANGSKLAFVSDRDGNEEIYVMNADGSGQIRLSNDPATDFSPSFSPNGSQITFTSSRDGNNEIYVMNADGTNPVRITNNSASDTGSSYSPDGTKIAFTSNRDGNTEVYSMNSDGSNQTNLSNSTALDGSGNFSPDGTKIAFTSDRSGRFEVYSMSADGTGQTVLSLSASGVSVDPAWQPIPAAPPPAVIPPVKPKPPVDTCTKLEALPSAARTTRWVRAGTALYRLSTTAPGYALRSSTAPLNFRVQTRGRAKVNRVDFAFPLAAAASRLAAVNKAPFSFSVLPSTSTVGNSAVTAAVSVRGSRKKLKLRLPFSIRNCQPASFDARLSTLKLGASPNLTLIAEARGAKLASAEFELPGRFSAKLFRRLRGVRVASLAAQTKTGRTNSVLRVGSVSASRVVFIDSQRKPRAEFVANKRTKRGVIKTLNLESGITELVVHLTGRPGSRKTHALLLINPSRCKRLSFAATLLGEEQTSVRLTRVVRVCRH